MLTTLSHRAMAAEFCILLAPSDQHLADAALDALEALDQIEANLTVYRPESEISKINSQAGICPVAVSESTLGLIQRSLQWSQHTSGAFDITAGPLVRAWGFTERKGQKPSSEKLRETLKRVGYQRVQVSPADRTVLLEMVGMEINLGAIGKGYALDQLADSLQQRGLRNFLIHGGGSSVLARGNQGARPQDSDSDDESTPGGWAVGIAHPTQSNHRLAGIRLHNEALSTSGTGKQFFHHRGRRYGHVIDPRTGHPAGDLLSLTTVAPNATDAEASSTAYFVMGFEKIRAYVADAQNTVEQGFPEPRFIATRELDRKGTVEVIPLSQFDWVDRPADPSGLG